MTKLESKVFDFIQKHILLITAIVITVLGILIRYFLMDYESGDFKCFLNVWWKQIESSGAKSLGKQIGDYNIPYQILIFLLTLTPLKPIVAYKLVSIVFDVVLAFSAGLLVYSLGNKSKVRALIAYSLTFCSLTVIFNSSLWAQCDSIYCSFILLAIFFLIKDKNALSFVMLGIAFAFKLQTVFIFPVFLFYYVATRKISLLHFLIIPIVDIIMCIPVFIFGRNPLDLVTIYANQTSTWKSIQANFPNIYVFICDGNNATYYALLKNMSIILTIIVLGFALGMIIYKKAELKSKYSFLLTAIWTVYTCVMFLPSMHERYSYLLDVLLIIFVVLTGKHFWVAIICNLASLNGYCWYLFKGYRVLDIKIYAVIYLAVYLYVTYLFAKNVVLSKEKPTNLLSA